MLVFKIAETLQCILKKTVHSLFTITIIYKEVFYERSPLKLLHKISETYLRTTFSKVASSKNEFILTYFSGFLLQP